MDEHEQYLWIILHTLRDQRIYVELSKCKFWLPSIAFLGNMVSMDEIILDSIKMEVINNWDRPTLLPMFVVLLC